MKQHGYTLAGALAMISVMSVLMALSLPVWTHVKQRDNEEELIFRGKEYVEAIARYHQKFNSYPPDLETLYKQKFLRKEYKDPMTESGEWKVLRPDSLVEAGEAGKINQPGSKKSLKTGEDEDEDENRNQNNNRMESSTDDDADNGNSSGDEEEELEEEETETLGPVAGVVSRSKKKSIKLFNGQDRYNKWVFTFTPQQQQQQGDQKPDDKDDKKDPKQRNPKDQPRNPGTKPPVSQPDDDNDDDG